MTKNSIVNIFEPQSNYVKEVFQECRLDTKYGSNHLLQGIEWKFPHTRWEERKFIVREIRLTYVLAISPGHFEHQLE